LILIVAKRIYRFMIMILILLLILPVIQYYSVRALDPHYVQFREPRGEALKVSAELDEDMGDKGAVIRFLYFLHEFYQNGI
jgi:hypothetical protein